MIQAIVYKSNTGFTAQYAKLLSEELSLPMYSIKEAKKALEKDTKIVYLGWLLGGMVQGFKQAKKRYFVLAYAGVGMGEKSVKVENDLVKQNPSESEAFYLQGGFDKTKLKGFYKFLMSLVVKMMSKQENKDENTKRMLEMYNNSENHVSKENLTEIIEYIKKLK
jgi:hypothetical protein